LGYKLNLKQTGFILDLFYAGLSLRKVCQQFRNTYGLPLSPATILRRVLCWVKDVDEALTYFMERGEQGFELQLGDTWEIDELHIPMNKKSLALIVVRDLKTAFDVGVNSADTVTSDAVKIALARAKAVAHKCPPELRCDGLSVYESAVRAVFGDRTKLSVHRRVRKEGQNQSIEGHNGVLRSRLNVMRSLHSKEKSSIIVKGLIINYNFVAPSSVLLDKTPSEQAFGKSADGIHSWYTLLELAEDYKKMVLKNVAKRMNVPALQSPKQLLALPETTRHLSLGFIALDHYFADSHEVAGGRAPVELAGASNTIKTKRECPAPLRLDEQHEEGLLTKKGKWIFNRTEKQTTFDNSAQLIVENNKQTTLDDFSNSM